MAAHARAPGHPERPERLAAVADGVADGAAGGGAALERPPSQPADDEALQRVHPRLVLRGAGRGGRARRRLDRRRHLRRPGLDGRRPAGGRRHAPGRAVRSGARRAAVAFAVVRPPGHHARPSDAAGFCLLNNVAIAAAGAARRAALAQRIAILDWDVHHGDGTQAIFDADPDVCYASTHQSPLLPGDRRAPRSGGPARRIGTKHNVPLPAGSGDEAFVAAWTSSCCRRSRHSGRRRSSSRPATTRTGTTRWPSSR